MRITKRNDQLESTVFVIFGGAGDLTWRKLVPALFDLFQRRSMPADFSVIAVDRVDLSDEKLRRRLHDGVKKFSRRGIVRRREWSEFARRIRYQQGDFKKLQTYTTLGKECAKLEKEWGAKVHRIFTWPHRRVCSAKSPNTSARPDWRATGMGADCGRETDRR